MSNKFKPINLSGVKTYPLSQRKSKVSTAEFAKTWQKGSHFKDFLDRLPDILAGNHLKTIISSTVKAFQENKTIVFAMGAHVIKVGLNPIVIDLMERGIITAVAMNGAGIIHDLELAMAGQTSEDVSASIGNGTFGMAHETGAFLCDAICRVCRENIQWTRGNHRGRNDRKKTSLFRTQHPCCRHPARYTRNSTCGIWNRHYSYASRV